MGNDFEAKVNQQVKRLRKDEYQTIESEVASKRIAWFKRNYQDRSNCNPPSPRTAYELLFFEYMGLSEEEVPVLSETETKIVWCRIQLSRTLKVQ